MLSIRIRQHTFQLHRRYSAGTVLTEGEARALNGLMAENIRNNVAGWIGEEQARTGEELLSEESIAGLQRRISAYQAGYQFGAGKPAVATPTSLEIELRRAVEEEVERMGEVGPGLDELRARLYSSPEIIELARGRHLAKQRVLAATWEDL